MKYFIFSILLIPVILFAQKDLNLSKNGIDTTSHIPKGLMVGDIAPNINLDEPDEDAFKLNLVSKTLDEKIDVFLSNSFGFGGTNSALIIKKYQN